MSGNLRPPLHVAQQSRRDKLRIQQTSIQSQKELLHVNNILYDPMLYASEMVNFLPSNTDDASSLRSFPRSQESCDWNQNTVFVDEIASSTLYSKPNFSSIHETMNTNSSGGITNHHECAGASKQFSEVYGSNLVLHQSIGESGWSSVVNEREFLPGYGNQASEISNAWRRRRLGSSDITHGLSLSLSSNPGTVCLNSANNKGYSSSLEDIVGGTSAIATHTAAGPLGPFTGYATILKCSKFLRPTQQLLEEFCDLAGCNTKEKSSEDGKVEKVDDDDEYDSCCVSATGERAEGRGGNNSSSGFSCHPEFHQKKATLLCLQEEVCRRFRQHQQQMQMVVSSFESVAGLSAATPYISQALNTVSGYFRGIKYAISDHLKNVRKALREDVDVPAAAEAPPSLFSLKPVHQKPKPGFPDPQQHHIWRPQRGLPERSVAILRAWLFDHFLHPYPTDTDKHMLATQTGLSRNQVSNWFINARVRVWKPMVEEIHMLETKGAATEAGMGAGRNEPKPATTTKGTALPNVGMPDPCRRDTVPEAASAMGGVVHQSHDKRARVDCRLPDVVCAAPLMEFTPYEGGGIEFGGLGAVSLTLGLRNNGEGIPQHQFLQRQHFGRHMIRDFAG